MNVYKLYTQLKGYRQQNETLWRDISRVVGISVDPDYAYGNRRNENEQLDQYTDDPTAAMSVFQQGDYLTGILWGTGDKALQLKPSRHVLDRADEASLTPWYNFATQQTLYHMNHPMAGLSTAWRPYAYEQASFGTSGLGCYKNTAFVRGVDENALVFRNYGIDNLVIDEGKSGVVEYVFVAHQWRVNRIVGEFCFTGGILDDKKLSKMPKKIQDAYRNKDLENVFPVVFGFMPREDFDPASKGKRGTRYRGVWFLDDGANSDIFHEEEFRERPIAICRQMRVRGERYGRSSGTMLISTIKSVNFIVGLAIEIMEKMGNPALGVWNSAVFGDNVIDTSPDGLTVFQQELSGGQNPAFPLYDVGDPAGIINFVVPYLNEKITTAFKIDILLDFNSRAEMTATESMQRYSIRGKSLAGLLMQQKVELLEPITRRSINVLLDVGELGIDASIYEEKASLLRKRGRQDRIIPPEVLAVIQEGKPWYELRFNNELEKMTRTEEVDDLMFMLNATALAMQINPQLAFAMDWYKWLARINSLKGDNNDIMLSGIDFDALVQKQAELQQMQLQMAAAQSGAMVAKDTAVAEKNSAVAQKARNE